MVQTNHASRLHLYLVKPSKYDDDGYVVRHWRGVLPSNTLACLYSLTEDVRRRGLLGQVDLRISVLDEAVIKIPLSKIAWQNRRAGEMALVCLVGVQTNQFCRAADIAMELRREGVPVILGGFHASGVLALFPGVSPEIQALLDAGVTVVAGEVEHRWADVLRDAHQGTLKPLYNFLSDLPDLRDAPIPLINKRYLRRFISSNFGTIDCSRGCPFNCSFCTIINVQGRKSRHRSPEAIAAMLRRNTLESGVDFYFFTDDDFARNPEWEAVFDEIIALRAEGLPITFMMQVDTLSYKIPGFVEKAARAGCSNVFIGMESINPKNLKAAGKTQNHVEDYRNLLKAWHDARVSTHVGYIIGFPYDTEQSVREDIERLMKEIQPHRASFFMLIPLPGSKDHKEMVEAGRTMDHDFNQFDSFHATMPHPHLTRDSWTEAYRSAWRSYYSFENMKAVLSRAHPDNYWDILKNFYWYKNSALNEGAHPMITGLFRIKDRATRRPGFEREGRLAHARRRIPEVYRYLRNLLRITLEMEELWLQTRHRSETERRVLEELDRMRMEVRRSLRISELQAGFERAKARIPSLTIPSRLSLAAQRLSLLRASRLRLSRRDLSDFWQDLGTALRRGRVSVLFRPDRIWLNLVREARLALEFSLAFASNGGSEMPSEP